MQAGRWRKEVHIAFVGAAVLLRWLPFAGVVGLAAAAVAFNTAILPRTGRLARAVYRVEDSPAALRGGIFWYPVMVLVVVLAFPLPIAAACWALVAVGDGMAALVGERMRTAPLPWNGAKSVGGSLAFFCCGTAAAAALFLFVRHNVAGYPPWWRESALTDACRAAGGVGLAVRLTAAGVVAALAESWPVRRLDDNVTVPVAGGGCLLASFMV